MDVLIYKVMHLVGIMVVFLGLGGAIIRSANNANRGRMIAAMTSGIGLLLILVSGFGMKARYEGAGMEIGWALWIVLKILIWVAIGASLVFINRKPRLALLLWICLIVLGGLAAYLGIYKTAAFG